MMRQGVRLGALSSAAVVWCCVLSLRGEAGDPTSSSASGVLQKYCQRCHGPGGTNEGGINFILDVEKLKAKKKLVPGDAAKSRLFQLVAKGEMPPEDEQPRPTPADLAVLERWIGEGAKPFESGAASRKKISVSDVLGAMEQKLRSLPAEDRPFQRFFTLTHLHNNPAFSDAELRLTRAALSKAVNSLSYKNRIVAPETLGEAGVVLAIDLRTLDWDRCHLWESLLKHYPYGLKYDRHSDSVLAERAREVYRYCGVDLPFIRADWFVAYATRPPLYHEILFERLMELPGCSLGDRNAGGVKTMSAIELERKLHIDVVGNIQQGKAFRAGFTASGVSGQNRIVERHESPFGAYWKSYDFISNDGQGNMFRYPLGPAFHGHPFPTLAFSHDGGEIIFHLPNGMQAYLLVNGRDDRINEGPIDVVSDSKKTSGTAKIVNGVSCIACHKQGMILPPTDAVQLGSSAQGDARQWVRRLYPDAAVLNKLVQEDSERFQASMIKAITPYLQPEDKSLLELEEPIGKLSRNYLLKELTLADAAFELGIDDPKLLAGAVATNGRLREMGLGPLAANGTIKREAWDSLSRFLSTFQEVAGELDLGTPKRVR